MDLWQEYRAAGDALAACYLILLTFSAVQLIRLQLLTRLWTKQKLFLLMLAVLCSIRAVFFLIGPSIGWWSNTGAVSGPISEIHHGILFILLNQLPTVLLFSTFSLLVLFWAEIYYDAIDQETHFRRVVRPFILGFNAISYLVEGVVLGVSTRDSRHELWIVSAAYFALVFAIASLGFVFYGLRVYDLVRKVPVHFKILGRVLREVGGITLVCGLCFSLRAGLSCYNAISDDLIEKENAVVLVIYYFGLEIVPSIVLLYFHRHLPPSRNPQRASEPAEDGETGVVTRAGDDGNGEEHGQMNGSSEPEGGRASAESTMIRGPSARLLAQADSSQAHEL